MIGNFSSPTTITSEMIDTFFRYNSGTKEFVSMQGNKQITMTTDAVFLKKEFCVKKVK